MNPIKCPVCLNDKAVAASQNVEKNNTEVECPRCGKFTITALAQSSLANFTTSQRTNLSGWIRENQEPLIVEGNLESLRELRTPSVSEKADKLLLRLAHKFPKPGETIELFENVSLELQAASWAVDHKELRYLMREYLHEATGFLLLSVNSSLILPDEFYKISPQGWAHLDSLHQENSQSKIGFIAMWFDKSVDPAWMAIESGIRNSGYEPLRIDRKEHNNKIDDEIIAGIRRSKFLVADFTNHRGGVYFEAGLAMGLGLPVIWLCRHDDLEKAHFDTRQYNHIPWEADKLGELAKALQNRIEATIGHGPLLQE